MANRERNKRSARQARQRERAAQESQVAASGAGKQEQAASESKTSSTLAKGAKSGPLSGVRTYLGDVRSEIHRVVWPSRKELVNYSVAVIVMLIIFGVLVWAVDTGFVWLLVQYTSLRG